MFCASQASTAICLSMNEASSSSSSNAHLLGGRAIDRHNPIIRDSKRDVVTRTLATPCSSQPPISPRPCRYQQKTRRSSSSKTCEMNKKDSSSKENDYQKKKASAVRVNSTEHVIKNSTSKPLDSVLRMSCVKSTQNIITPAGSSRYLLSETELVRGVAECDPVLALVPFDYRKAPQHAHQDELKISSKSQCSSSPCKSSSSNQVEVVELRVSLHCKGCEGKVRKHLSKMEGVTSFTIDYAAKKVTIVGNVSPLGVLNSVAKVKNAQFWPASPVESASAETKK